MEKSTQRGMLKWKPYKSLEPQEEYLQREFENKRKIEKPILSQEDEEEINNMLVNYHNQQIKITFYSNGKLITTSGLISKIDVINQILKVEKKSIPFCNLISIKNL